MAYRTLIVAPETDLLLVEDEVQAVVNLLNARMLRGHVTASEVVDMVQHGFDVIWFATHGAVEGILLSDGYVDASSLTTIMRTAGASLVVLNTCESFEVAMTMHNELLLSVICTVRKVPDMSAFLTAKQFAYHLSRGLGYYDAYLMAKPGQNTTYLYLMGRSSGMSIPETPRNTSSPELARLIALIDGDEKWQQPGLMNTVNQISRRMDRTETRLTWLWVVVTGLLVVEILIAILLLVDRFGTVASVTVPILLWLSHL